MRYSVVTASSTTELCTKVTAKLARGWELVGGVSAVSYTEYRTEYCQAMVLN